MGLIEHKQVFGLRSAELGDQPGETHDFILVTDADEYVREIERLSRQLAGAVEALKEIKRDCGKVCAEFELCDHVACQSSVAAWMIADKTLAAIGGQ